MLTYNKTRYVLLAMGALIGQAPVEAIASNSYTNKVIASFYTMGIGAHYLSETLVRQFAVASDSNSTNSDESFSVKLKTIVLQAFIRVQLEQFLIRHGQPQATASLLHAFDAGIKLPFMIEFAKAASEVGYDFYHFGGSLFKQLGYALIDGATASYKSAINSFKRTINGSDDLDYPLVSDSGTQLSCGFKDPYCINSNTRQQDNNDVSMLSDPDEFDLNLLRLGIEGCGVSLGAFLAIASYSLGSTILRPVQDIFYSPILGEPSSMAAHIVDGYVDANLVEEVTGSMHPALEAFEKAVEEDHADVLSLTDVKEAIAFGEKGRKVATATTHLYNRRLATAVTQLLQNRR